MSRYLITGAAGFIGSHLARTLINDGHGVIGIDSFEDYYARELKEQNLAPIVDHSRFELLRANLLDVPLAGILDRVDAVFHTAAQAGVRASWGASFDIYTRNNIAATQIILETLIDFPHVPLIYSSSSSVYGDTDTLPFNENNRLRPLSPYGVTKLAAENLCQLYHKNFGLHTVSLRYFTVFGPGQRPDMAFHRFCKAALLQEPLVVFGDGGQTRDFTYIDDIVGANLLALRSPAGEIYNIGGGSRITLLDAIDKIARISGRKLNLEFKAKQKGDVKDTLADISKAKRLLGYSPRYDVARGLQNEYKWIERIYLQGRQT